MSGTINIALTQQFDMDGEPLGGGLLYFFEAASTNPQNAFQDSGLTVVHPNPIVLAADGRVPMFYLASTSAEGNASGQIKIRLTDKTGVTVLAADSLLIIGPAGGGSGPGPGVDPTTVLQTGDIISRFGTGTHPGFLPCNGNTLGNSVSGASYAAAENQPLFEYLWSTGVLGVFSGTTPNRGANSLNDWNAGKRIVLPDLRGRAIAGLDDMGSSAIGRLTNAGLGSSGTVLGNAGGTETNTLSTANIPSHTHPQQGIFTSSIQNQGHTHTQQGNFTTGGESTTHTHGYSQFSATQTVTPGGGAGAGSASGATTSANSNGHTHDFSIFGETAGASADHNHTVTLTGTNTGATGSGTAFSRTQPTMVMTFYIKL